MKNIWPDINLPILSSIDTQLWQIGYKVCKAHGVGFQELRQKKKTKGLSSARREFCRIAYREITNITQRKLAEFLDRDVSTINSLINEDSEYYKPRIK